MTGGLQPLLRVDELAKRFPLRRGVLGRVVGEVHAVEGVSFAVQQGTTLGLVGESGCGKSTLARLILALIPPTGGRVMLGDTDVTAMTGEPLRHLRRRMQMVFQNPYASLNPRMKLADIVAEPLEIHRPELSKRERTERVQSLLERVGLRLDQRARRPTELSGGQRQRVAIARALAAEPELVVADEPVSALDVSIQAQILNLLDEIRRERTLTMLFVSHDLRVVEHVSDEVAVMYLGRLVEHAPARALFERPLHPYTAALVSAVPGARAIRKRAPVILEGEIPSPLSPPKGCAFHPRCHVRRRLDATQQARCSAEKPPLACLEAGRRTACYFADRA